MGSISKNHPSRVGLSLIAIAIGLITVVIFNGTVMIVGGIPRHLEFEIIISVIQVILVSIPFLLNAFLNIRLVASWIVGIALTSSLWGYFLYYVISHRGDGSGANIGLGLLICISPIIISTACLFVARKEIQGRHTEP